MLDTMFSAEDPMDAQTNTYESQPSYSVDDTLGAQAVQSENTEAVVAAEMSNAGSADAAIEANGSDMVQPAAVGSGHTTLQLQDGELASDRVADLVEYIVCGLVTDKDAVALDVTDSHGGALIEISCAADDAGRIIGRKGRTIKAIRTLARALGSRVNTAVEVEVLG